MAWSEMLCLHTLDPGRAPSRGVGTRPPALAVTAAGSRFWLPRGTVGLIFQREDLLEGPGDLGILP